MDDATLSSLKAALAASPDNGPLLALLLRAHLTRGELPAARELLGTRAPEHLPEQDRHVGAQVLLESGDARRALLFCQGSTAEQALWAARAHLALEELDAARAAYQRAVTANATLEDMDLRARLSARVAEVPAPQGGPRLRVISNDDTTEEDVARAVAPPLPPITFADVGGLDEVKRQVTRRIIQPFQKPSLFERFRRKAGGGILLYGPPGCGKTLLARATAGECKAHFFNVVISDVLDMYIGESERKLHALFEKARQSTPSVLFFDELEALAAKRQYSREAASGKLVSQFLTEMDGFAQTNSGVLVLGATNTPWAIDPAFRRPGRFDRVFFVPPPDAPARRDILLLALKGRPQEANLDLDFIVQRTQGFSGADLSHVVETASDLAIERSLDAGAESPLRDEDLKAALREVKPTVLEWLTTARNYARYANEGGQYDEVLSFLQAHGKS
ncbi:26S protease regulatory subunit [Myxococcus sp. RHSTA-1-4]|uniref:ATP-binding protein n=1 Tax=Myxococcus sp. RHSTA-1-4 TaxID=2874601 RepID=UPI001CBF984E|nr:ATP-binding protein [Myxococcus sp. RHSTA-1-4]MBZ4420789.1 ATP-binding protein [Myxococcus sp. RHSTA-1-4]